MYFDQSPLFLKDGRFNFYTVKLLKDNQQINDGQSTQAVKFFDERVKHNVAEKNSQFSLRSHNIKFGHGTSQ